MEYHISDNNNDQILSEIIFALSSEGSKTDTSESDQIVNFVMEKLSPSDHILMLGKIFDIYKEFSDAVLFSRPANSSPRDKVFRMVLPHNEGVATIKQTTNGEFYIWIENESFSEGGFQAFNTHPTFEAAVRCVLDKVIPDIETHSNRDPFKGMTQTDINQKSRDSALKITKNSVYGSFRKIR